MQPYELLEKELAEWMGLEPECMVACSSGTASLHLAMECFSEEIGAEPVVCPDYTMISCARAITLAGKLPIFVGCGHDLRMDLSSVSREASVLIVHIYGRQVVPPTTYRVQVEDMAELHGKKPQEGTDAACWSFYRNKIVHGEEGGAVWFANPDKAYLARSLRNVGFTAEHNFIHTPGGYNYRLANCLAELIRTSLREFYHHNDRRQVEAIYGRLVPPHWQMPRRDSPWVYDLRIPGELWSTLGQIVASLNNQGIQARMGFCPMSLQAEYRHLSATEGRTIRAFNEVMYLPLDIGQDQAQLAAEALIEAVLAYES